jgi:hypothetical protein
LSGEAKQRDHEPYGAFNSKGTGYSPMKKVLMCHARTSKRLNSLGFWRASQTATVRPKTSDQIAAKRTGQTNAKAAIDGLVGL